MKDEIDYRQCQTFDELKQLVDEYIYEYNYHRYQWNLKKMTPAQYRSHLIAA
ncbi:IS3 family transposase [Bhargavaea ginsengi]